jgi:hypothetical protein
MMAGIIPNLPNYSFYLPWFMFDMQNYQLIISTLPPSDITDRKAITLTETPIPGLNYSPLQPSNNGNRKISFTLPLIKRNNTLGNVGFIKQFDRLRNQSTGFLQVAAQQFTPNPKVLYSWGIGSVPLVYYVSKCDFTHKQGWVAPSGNPMYSEVEMELTLDEENPLYQAEEMWRLVASLIGEVEGAIDTGLQIAGVRPF